MRRVGVARGLRRQQTQAEKKLWTMLRNRQLNGVKFRRQEPLGRYVADFVSFEKSLIIEVDGGHHSEDDSVEKDNERTESLRLQGFRVIRFWNSDIKSNLNGVIMRIKEALAE